MKNERLEIKEEFARLECEIKFTDNPDVRRKAMRRYLELTDKEFA